MDKVIRTYMPGNRTEDVRIENPMDLDECRKTIGFMIEVHYYGGLHVLCDEEGKLRNLPKCLCLDGCVYRGNLMVGVLTDDGLEPATSEQFAEFEKHITLRF